MSDDCPLVLAENQGETSEKTKASLELTYSNEMLAGDASRNVGNELANSPRTEGTKPSTEQRENLRNMCMDTVGTFDCGRHPVCRHSVAINDAEDDAATNEVRDQSSVLLLPTQFFTRVIHVSNSILH